MGALLHAFPRSKSSRVLLVAFCVVLSFRPVRAQTQCGGEERWAVKMAADTGAASIDFQNPVATTLHDLVRLPRPTLPSDDVTRTVEEKIVRTVNGRLIRFKKETGKTGDSDFHLVISDATMLYSPGGPSSQASAHSFIAEIPDPACVAGREGTVTTPSRFAQELGTVLAAFNQRFPDPTHAWNELEGIPVRLTGVVFFDKPHGQVGRALNGLELHPLLAIEFLTAPPVEPGMISTTVALANPGFETGSTGWMSTTEVITANAVEPAHSGSAVAWLGGTGASHTDRLSQDVTLPASANAISLTFFMHIDTEEQGSTAFDKLRVRVRSGNGAFKTLKTVSNLSAASGYILHAVDLTEFKGKNIRIQLEATEDNGSVTSFLVDDFTVVVEVP